MRSKLKTWFGSQNMTEGRPLSVLVRFSLPLLIGNIFQLLYNTFNAMIVGNLIGSNALAAVGTCTPIMNLFFTFYMTVGTGVSIVVSQFYGAGDNDRLSRSIGTSLVLALIATLSITALGIPLSGPIMHLIKVDESIFDWSHQYLMIMFAGAIGVGFFNVISGVLRGLGDSVFPLLVLVCTSILNIILVYLFVGVFGYGVAGAAIATVISQTLSAVACLFKLFRIKHIVVIPKKVIRLYRDMVGHILRIGLPSGIQQVILMTSATFVQFLINGIVVFSPAGVASQTIFLAAHTVFNTVDSVTQLPNQAVGLGTSTYTGQNIGAGRFDRVSQGFKVVMATTFTVAAIMTVIIWLFGGDLLKLFIDMNAPDAAEIIGWGIRIQRIYVWCYIGTALIQAPSGMLRGAGSTMPVMWITIFCTVILRMPMAYIWVHSGVSDVAPGGYFGGIYWSMVICTAIAGVMSMAYYLSGRWKRKLIVAT